MAAAPATGVAEAIEESAAGETGLAVGGRIGAIWLAMLLRNTVSRWVLGLIAAQFILGPADILLLAPTWLQVLHLLGAALYWIALVAACVSVLAPARSRVTAAV